MLSTYGANTQTRSGRALGACSMNGEAVTSDEAILPSVIDSAAVVTSDDTNLPAMIESDGVVMGERKNVR